MIIVSFSFYVDFLTLLDHLLGIIRIVQRCTRYWASLFDLYGSLRGKLLLSLVSIELTNVSMSGWSIAHT